MAKLKNVNYNPDVLNCLANLSNDEVFTPPEVVNKMLDLLPPELWKNKNVKFLDPCCKTGVFLREITLRLKDGLQDEIPDLHERINHILTNQVYGIAITELTSLLSRRSVYCSRNANSKYSICNSFSTIEGNIFFKKANHIWHKNNCEFCGAVKKLHDRSLDLESYAYPFIHLSLEEIISMKIEFDVIIGNPPYQINDGGGDGSSAKPLYHKFVEQAKKLNPRYISMIIPARWYTGGKGLDEFRYSMLTDNRLKELHDFPETSDCFPGLNIRGGVCYFLWDKNYRDTVCEIYNHKGDSAPVVTKRPLLEADTMCFIRYNNAISILNKVKQLGEENYGERVMSRNVFDIPSNFSKYTTTQVLDSDKILYRSDRGSSKKTQTHFFVNESYIKRNHELINKIKVLVSKASPGGDTYPHQVISTPIVAKAGSVCTETYLLIDCVDSVEEGINLVSYMKTKFFRFLVALLKPTQNISKSVFRYVPVLDLSKEWTDDMLYKRYNLNEEEINFIESMVKPMK